MKDGVVCYRVRKEQERGLAGLDRGAHLAIFVELDNDGFARAVLQPDKVAALLRGDGNVADDPMCGTQYQRRGTLPRCAGPRTLSQARAVRRSTWRSRRPRRRRPSFMITEGCAGANKKASPPGRQQRCTFSPTTFSSVQFGLDFIGLFSFFDHYIISGEVIGFRLFRATGILYVGEVIGFRLFVYSKFSFVGIRLGLYWVLFSFFDNYISKFSSF